MKETLNILYRLFAPIFVVVLVVGGVGLSSELVKNSKEKQTAITIAYAGGCPSGAIPVAESCTARDSKGKILPLRCSATHPVAGVVSGNCMDWNGIGCCMGMKWPDAKTSISSQGGLGASGGIGSSIGSGLGALKSISGLMSSIQQMMQMSGGQDSQPQDQYGIKAPVCKSVVKSPTLPLRPGDSATLTWLLEGGKATSVVVSPGAGAVQGFSVRVTPRVSTTYTVTARNSAGSSTCPKIRVHVGPGSDLSDETTSNGQAPTYEQPDIWSGNDSEQPRPYSTYDNLNEEYTPGNDAEVVVYDPEGINNAEEAPTPPPVVYTGILTPVVSGTGTVAPEYNPADVSYEELGFEEWSGPEYAGVDTGNANSSGLTDQEIYGVWNRPQNPTTGGFGSLQQVVTGSDIDIEPEEGTSIFSRFGRWVKGVFCFWCNNTVYINRQAAAASATVAVESRACNQSGVKATLTIDKIEVTRPACEASMSKQECDDAWLGGDVSISWSVPCGYVCELVGPDGPIETGIKYNYGINGRVRKNSRFDMFCTNDSGGVSTDSTTVNVSI